MPVMLEMVTAGDGDRYLFQVNLEKIPVTISSSHRVVTRLSA